MAELADALDLGSSSFGVQVRFLLSALNKLNSNQYVIHKNVCIRRVYIKKTHFI
uniref:Uncharacterized protein n=1 Tax=Siphoviridae sp. ctnsL8 TaxID=2825666 RepID=A0A8S5PNC4_9CAUD|nr:MAG TPA: hypothetical protein [Siphoviridae sp. ctnsL8]